MYNRVTVNPEGCVELRKVQIKIRRIAQFTLKGDTKKACALNFYKAMMIKMKTKSFILNQIKKLLSKGGLL